MKNNVKYFFKDKNSLNKGYTKVGYEDDDFDEERGVLIVENTKNSKLSIIDSTSDFLIFLSNIVCIYFGYKIFSENESIEPLIILFTNIFTLMLFSIKNIFIKK